MKPIVKGFFAGLSLAALSFGAWYCQRDTRAGENLVEAPSPAAEMIVAGLGGFRGIIAEVVWFRADRLQDEARYAELAQLSTWLTFLEPRTPEVWSFAAWNLAYNISVTMPTPADRWRWVEAGIKLLRDDGLRLNPNNPVLYRELAYMFLLKLSAGLDDACAYYCDEWKKKIEKLVAEKRLSEIKLDKKRMGEIDEEYGKMDWTLPLASAIYWAHSGIVLCEGSSSANANREKNELRRILYQSLMILSRKDSRFAPRCLKEMQKAYEESPSEILRNVTEKFRSTYRLR